MPSFSCDGCGDIIKKPKLDAHQSRCRHALFTCLDCQTTFHGFDYRKHTTCITEAQKYHGASAKAAKPPKQPRHQAYVEDTAESPAPPRPQTVVKVVPPPPAPSPPPTNVDVWDYLVSDTPAAGAKRVKSRVHEDPYFSYGDGPVKVGKTASEKKRKRHQPQDINTPTAPNQSTLHTGLTGSLDQLLEPQNSQANGASPLSPKKQSSGSIQQGDAERSDSEVRALKRRQKHNSVEGSKELISVPKSGPLARETLSHSELFVGLIDKPHSSSKGESIWSLLKRFDELRPERDDDHKRLLSGLRVKRGKDGGFVLFTRKDKEMD